MDEKSLIVTLGIEPSTVGTNIDEGVILLGTDNDLEKDGLRVAGIVVFSCGVSSANWDMSFAKSQDTNETSVDFMMFKLCFVRFIG